VTLTRGTGSLQLALGHASQDLGQIDIHAAFPDCPARLRLRF
jgi:hypothetical protein